MNLLLYYYYIYDYNLQGQIRLKMKKIFCILNNTSLILILIFPSHKKFKDSCREYFSGLETELMRYLKVIYSQLFNLIRYTKYYRIGIK